MDKRRFFSFADGSRWGVVTGVAWLAAGTLFVILAVAACMSSSTPTPTQTPPTPTATSTPQAARQRIEVLVGGSPVMSFGARDLGGLPQRPLADGSGQAATLLSLLQRAGVTDFARVKVVGSNKSGLAGKEAVLAREDITDSVLLALTSLGSANLTGPGLAEGQKVFAVSRIEVENGVRPTGEYSIEVSLKGQTVKSLGLADLKKLEAKTFGDDQGPTLLSVLKLAGVQEFNKVTVVGLHRGRKGALAITFARDEVTDRLILDFTNQGTVKLTAPDIPPELRVIDVFRLDVE